MEPPGTYNVSFIPYRATQVSAVVVVVIAICDDVVKVEIAEAVVVVGTANDVVVVSFPTFQQALMSTLTRTGLLLLLGVRTIFMAFA